MRWLKTLVLLLFVLLLSIGAGLWWATATESGARALVGLAQRLGGERLRIGAVEGTLLDEIELRDLAYRQPGMRVGIMRARFAWSPFELIGRVLHVRELRVDGLRYAVTDDAPPAPAEEKTTSGLPGLRLPVRIRIDRVALNDVSARLAPETEPLRLRSARLVADWDDEGISLERLSLDAPDGQLELSGSLDPIGDYPLKLDNRITLTRAGLPHLTLNGDIQGDLRRLRLQQKLGGDIEAKIDATLSELLEKPGWQADIALQRLRPGQFSDDVPGVLSGTLRGKGDLATAELGGDLRLRAKQQPEFNWNARLAAHAAFDELALRLDQLRLSRDDSAARLDASGRYDRKHMQLDARWRALQWPLGGAPEVASRHGRIEIQGVPEDYRLTFDAEVAGRQVPAGAWRGRGNGSLERLHLEELVGDTLDGQLRLSGDVAWKPQVSWKMQTRVARIDPGKQFKEWPGRLSLRALSEGRLDANGGVHARLRLEQLDGRLRGLPVAGSGGIRIAPERYRFDGFQLRSGSARLEADGVLGGDSALRWKLAVPKMADLLPDASGSLNAAGRLAGDFRQPRVDARIDARKLKLAGHSIERLDSKLDLDLTWKRPSKLRLRGNGLVADGQSIARLDVDADGTLQKHRVSLKADHELAKLEMTAAGGYVDKHWRGAIQQLQALSERFGDWVLTRPMKLDAGADRAKVEHFCVRREAGRVCAEGRWSAAKHGGELRFDAEKLQLAWVGPWLPPAIESLGGALNAAGEAAFGRSPKQLRAKLQADISPGRIAYRIDARPGEVMHQGGKLKLRVANGGVKADLDLGLAENRAQVLFSSPRLLAGGDIQKAPISGRVRIDARHFDIVRALVPEIDALEGAVTSDYQIAGRLGRPLLKGNGRIAIAHFSLTDFGVELDESRIDLLAQGRKLVIDGGLHSHGGELKLNGAVELDAERHWPLKLALKGSRFRIVQMPDIQVDISPDIRVARNAKKTQIIGKIKVDKADILLNELPEGARSASDDIIVVRKNAPPAEEQAPSLPLYARLDLILGKEVHFIGFGLNAFIDGRLRIVAEPKEPLKGSGEIRIEQGTYRAYGQNLDIETGIISFPGGPLTKPGINLRATRQLDNVVVGISAIGPVQKPRITTFSQPAMAERDVISYLLTGAPTSKIGKGGAGMLSVGKQINSKLSVSLGSDPDTGDAEVKTNYRLSRKIRLQATTGGKSNAFDIFYTFER